MGQVSLSSDQSSISSSDSASPVGNMSLRNNLNYVNKLIKFLISNIPGKNDKNGSLVKTRNTNKQTKVLNYENKFIESLQSISCLNFQDTLGDRKTFYFIFSFECLLDSFS